MIAARPGHGDFVERLARAAVARHLGALPSGTPFSDRLLRAYMALFDGPLSDQEVAAIEELVLVVKKTKASIPVADAGVGHLGLLVTV